MPNYLSSENEFITQNFEILDSSGWFEAVSDSDISATGFLSEYKASFGMGNDDDFVLKRITNDDYPFMPEDKRFTHERYNQTYKGVPVEFAEFFLHHKNGSVKFINCKLAEGLNMSINPLLTEVEALNAAINYLGDMHLYSWLDSTYEEGYKEEKGDPDATSKPTGELLITKLTNSNSFVSDEFALAWKFKILALDTSINLTVYINANTGAYIKHRENMRSGTTNLSYGYGNGAYIDTWWRSGTYQHHVLRCDDANGSKVWTKRAAYKTSNAGGGVKQFGDFNCTIWPTNPNKDCTENLFDADDNWGDQLAATAHWAGMNTWDFFKNNFNWVGFDGNGGELKILVDVTQTANYTPYYGADMLPNGVMWIGKHETNGKYYCTRDVIGHEFTHAITTATADFDYAYESGALDESFADIFGYMVERYANGNVHTDWEIAEDVEMERKMNNPSQSKAHISPNNVSFTQPSVYQGINWYTGTWQSWDNGGVHINSGVQNYWFYLLSEGSLNAPDGTHQNIVVNGITADKAAKIAFYNLDNYMGTFSNYHDARQGSLIAASIIFDRCSNEYKQTNNAWAAVGLANTDPPLDITGPFIIYHVGGVISGGMPKNYVASGGYPKRQKIVGFTKRKQYDWIYFGPWATGTITSGDVYDNIFTVQNFNNHLLTSSITVSDKCSALTKQIKFIDLGRIIISPNPTSDILHVEVEFPDANPEDPIIIRIIDLAGIQRFFATYDEPTPLLTDIDVSFLDPGSYEITAQQGSFLQSKQFIKE